MTRHAPNNLQFEVGQLEVAKQLELGLLQRPWRWRETPFGLSPLGYIHFLHSSSNLRKRGQRRRSSCEATRSSPTTIDFDLYLHVKLRSNSVFPNNHQGGGERRLSGSSPLGLRYFSHSQFSRKGGRGEGSGEAARGPPLGLPLLLCVNLPKFDAGRG